MIITSQGEHQVDSSPKDKASATAAIDTPANICNIKFIFEAFPTSPK